MKREDITKIFPDATKEQLDSIMAINGSDIQKAKAGSEDLKNQLAEANEKLEQQNASAAELERLKGVEEELNQLKEANSLREMREKVSKATGIPIDLLRGETEEECTAFAGLIRDFAKPAVYPAAPIGGEPGGAGKAPTTAEQFAEWSEGIF